MKMMRTNRSVRPGVTIVEVAIVLLVIVVVLAVLVPMTSVRGRLPARQLKDATQIRIITQGMAMFAQNNGDQYPLPSWLDAGDTTVAAVEDPTIKDNTGNILSILIWQGAVSPELCITPAEANTAQVVRDDGYEFANPAAALAAGGDPARALWDPGFAGTPVDSEGYRRGGVGGGRVAHQSYAHMLPVGRRLGAWSNTFVSTEALLGSRGPAYQETAAPASGRYRLNPTGAAAPGVDSNALLIHGGRNSWSGNIGYNDGHVAFETRPDPDGITYARAGGERAERVRDNLFIDEVDERDEMGAAAGTDVRKKVNQFLRPVARLPRGIGAPSEGASGSPDLWVD